MPVTVTDLSGKPVSGLSAADFAGQLRGNPVAVLSAKAEISPRIVLILDASGSMSEVSKPVLAVARDLVNRLPPSHPLSFFVFATKVEKMVDFTSEREPVLEQIDALESGSKVLRMGFGRTILWDTVLEALNSFGTPHIGDAIYAITDGGDNQSRASLAMAEKELLSAGVRFFAILPPPPKGPAMLEEIRGPQNLYELARATGGFLMKSYVTHLGGTSVALDSDQLSAEVNLLYAWTFHFYVLEIQPVEFVGRVRDWQLELQDSGNTSKSDRILGYPHKIAPCLTKGKTR